MKTKPRPTDGEIADAFICIVRNVPPAELTDELRSMKEAVKMSGLIRIDNLPQFDIIVKWINNNKEIDDFLHDESIDSGI